MGQRNDNGSHGLPTDLQYIYIYIYIMKIFLTAFLKFFFYMRVIWVAGRTRTPIIGSLQKSRENPGSTLKVENNARRSSFIEKLAQLIRNYIHLANLPEF